MSLNGYGSSTSFRESLFQFINFRKLYLNMRSGYQIYLTLSFFLKLILFKSAVFGQYNSEAQRIPDINTPIRTITQDNDGVLWMGTWQGVIKYDGLKTEVFKSNNMQKGSIKGRRVFDIEADKKGRIWIATLDKGLLFFEKETSRFRSFSELSNDSFNFEGAQNLLIDKHENLWVGTIDSLYCITNLYSEEPKVIPVAIPWQMSTTDLTIHNNGIWLSSSDGLFYIKQNKIGEPQKVWVVIENKFKRYSDYIFNVKIHTVNHKNYLVIADRQGIRQYGMPEAKNFDNDTIFLGEINNIRNNKNMFIDKSRIWTIENGKILFGLIDGQVINLNSSLQGNSIMFQTEEFKPEITEIHKAIDGTIWMVGETGLWKAISSESVFKSYKKEINAIFDLEKLHVSAVASYNNQVIIGSPNHGIFLAKIGDNSRLINFTRYKAKTPVIDKRLKRVKNFYIDSKKRLWLATIGNGIYIADLAKNKEIEFEPLNFKHSDFKDDVLDYSTFITEIPNSEMLIGTYSKGLFHLKSTGEFIAHYSVDSTFLQNRIRTPITVVLAESNEIIWVGTQGKGVVKMNISDHVPSFFPLRSNSNDTISLSDDFITDLCFDHLGGLWIGTENGLNLFDRRNNSLVILSEDDGLPNNNIQGIIEDDNRNIWAATKNGLAKINPMYFNKNHSFSHGIKSYIFLDALSENSYTFRTSYKTDKGLLLFGTESDIVSHLPAQKEKPAVESKLYFKNLYIDQKVIYPLESINERIILNKALDYQSEIFLKPKENNISLSFGAISYNSGKNTKFAYRIESVHKNWFYTDSEHPMVTYTNLPAGKNTFELRVTKSDGTWGTTIRELTIHRALPFYKTKKAFVIYIFIFLLLFFSILRIIRNRYKIKALIKIESNKRKQMEESVQDKMRFFTNISHELKSPLSLILGPLLNLRQEEKTGKTKEWIDVAYRNATRLNELVLQILEFRKVENSMLKLDIEKGNIDEFLTKIHADFQYLANQKNIELILTGDAKEQTTWFDKDKIKKVLFNLLSNAIKFTPANGKIIIDYVVELKETENKILVIKVSDTGIGIPMDKLPDIFNRFYQGEHSAGGFGIGLALTKKLIKLHKGNIDVQSLEGQGTCFTFKVPVNETSYSQEEMMPVKQAVEMQNISVPSLSPLEYEDEEEVAGLPCLLVVEDDIDLNNYIKSIFFGIFNVQQAFNGSQAVKKVKERKPDIVITDLMMPEMDGVELIEQLKKKHDTENIPVILLTASNDVEKQKKSLKLGASVFINKPFDPELLKVQVLSLHNQSLQSLQHIKTEVLTQTATKTPIADSFEKKVIKIIERNLSSENFSVQDLADKLNMSRVNLYREIKKHMNLSPMELIRKIRLKHAAKLIQNMDVNISEAAYQCGFMDQKHFRNCFKKEFGVTPSEFKKKFKQ